MPMGLPPVRGHGHAIILKHGTPHKCRVVSLSPFSKSEIEKLVS